MAEALFNAFSVYYYRHCHDAHGPRVGKPVPKGIIASANAESDVKGSNNSDSKSIKNKDLKSGNRLKGTTYHVQILSALKQIPAGDSEIRGVPEVNFFRDGKFYKYYSGCFSSRAEAKKHLSTLQKRFPKAFVISLRDGKPIK